MLVQESDWLSYDTDAGCWGQINSHMQKKISRILGVMMQPD
jgi:hypothetical protein